MRKKNRNVSVPKAPVYDPDIVYADEYSVVCNLGTPTEMLLPDRLKDIEKIPGPPGPAGPQGPKGGSVHIKGTVATPPTEKPTDPDDAYLCNGDLYVWDGTAWHNVGKIQGPKGEQGLPGAAGAVGPVGPDGAPGKDGKDGVDGPKGDKGDTGESGLQGPKGDTGPAGKDGGVGIQGPQGLPGLNGAPGASGIGGPAGKDGATGKDGAPGKDGAIGPQGPAGPQGQKGGSVHIKGTVSKPPTTAPADPDDAYLCNGDLYVWDGGRWLNVGKIQGPQGDKGTDGKQGVDGKQGEKGDKGDKGDQGDKGLTGPEGPRGWPGIPGPAGIFTDAIIASIAGAAAGTAASMVMAEMPTAKDFAEMAAVAANDVVQGVVDKAIEDLGDLRGDKGEKGDKGKQGDKGDAGAACTIVGHVDSATQLPLPTKEKAGQGYLVGDNNDLYMCLEKVGGIWWWSKVGNIQGPQGKPGLLEITVKDEAFQNVDVIKCDNEEDLWIVQDKGIVFKTLDGKNVGFKIGMKYPIPDLEEHEATGTKDKILSNDGKELKWIDAPESKKDKRAILKSPNGSLWEICVGNLGRLATLPVTNVEGVENITLTSPDGSPWLLSVGNQGRLNTSRRNANG